MRQLLVLIVLPVLVTSGCRSPVAGRAGNEAAAEPQSATRPASPYTGAVARKVSGVVGGHNPQLILTPRQVDRLAALLPELDQSPQAHTDTATIAGPPRFIVVFDRVSGPPMEVWLYAGVSDSAIALLNAAFKRGIDRRPSHNPPTHRTGPDFGELGRVAV